MSHLQVIQPAETAAIRDLLNSKNKSDKVALDIYMYIFRLNMCYTNHTYGESEYTNGKATYTQVYSECRRLGIACNDRKHAYRCCGILEANGLIEKRKIVANGQIKHIFFLPKSQMPQRLPQKCHKNDDIYQRVMPDVATEMPQRLPQDQVYTSYISDNNICNNIHAQLDSIVDNFELVGYFDDNCRKAVETAGGQLEMIPAVTAEDKNNVVELRQLLGEMYCSNSAHTSDNKDSWSAAIKHYTAWLDSLAERTLPSSIPELSNSDSTEPQTKSSPTKKSKKIKARGLSAKHQQLFEKIWKVYPRKLGKQRACKKFEHIICTHDADFVLEAAEVFAEYHRIRNTEERFIPHGATWFNSPDSFTPEQINAMREEIQKLKQSGENHGNNGRYTHKSKLERTADEIRQQNEELYQLVTKDDSEEGWEGWND